MSKRSGAGGGPQAPSIAGSCRYCGEGEGLVPAIPTTNMLYATAVATTASQCDLGTAVTDLVSELVYEPVATVDHARDWLHRLRRSVHAAEALLWRVTGTRATAVLHASAHATRSSAVHLEGRETAVDRERRNGQLTCSTGDRPVVKEVVPPGVTTFIVADATRGRRLSSLLVLGWTTSMPLCGTSSVPPLRIAAAMLDRAVGNRRRHNTIAAKVLASQEAERSRIARDLHDDVGQQVALLDAALATAMRQPFSRTHAESTMLAARTKLHEISHSIHTLAHALHPAKLKLLGLVTTLESLCRDISIEAQTSVRFEATQVPADIADDVAVSMFRLAQEGLQNAVKHSGASTIAVQLIGRGDSLLLRIADDGGGFDPLTHASGLGLLTMRERVEMMGGTLTVTTAPAHGTTIEVIVRSKGRCGTPRPAAVDHDEMP
jgi:signal transduction histidine kinase